MYVVAVRTLGSLLLLLGLVLETGTASLQKNNDDKVRLRCRTESTKRFDREAVRIGGDIKPPKKLVDIQPEFPEFPSNTTASGIWMGELLVGPDGLVADAWTVREPTFDPPFPEFNEAVLTAIRKWKYEPVTVQGEAVPFCMVVTVNIDVS